MVTVEAEKTEELRKLKEKQVNNGLSKGGNGDPIESEPTKEEKIINKMEKRINDLTKKLKEVEEKTDTSNSQNQKDEEAELMEEIEAEAVKCQDKKKEIRKSLRKAIVDEDDVLADKLERELDEVESIIRRVEKDYDKTIDKKKIKEKNKVFDENAKAWNNSFQKGVNKFSDVLLTKEGKLDQNSELWKMTEKLLSKNAVKAKFIKNLHEKINPEYDHKDGIYIALHDAMSLTKDKKPTKNNSTDKDYKNQSFSTNRQVAISDGDSKTEYDNKLAGMKADAEKHGNNSRAGAAYYKELRKGYKSFSDRK